jgi:hypothetical protein
MTVLAIKNYEDKIEIAADRGVDELVIRKVPQDSVEI